MWKRVKKGIGCRCEDDNEGEDEKKQRHKVFSHYGTKHRNDQREILK
jgi:hypothetical protein